MSDPILREIVTCLETWIARQRELERAIEAISVREASPSARRSAARLRAEAERLREEASRRVEALARGCGRDQGIWG